VIGSAGRLCSVKDYSFMIEIAKAVKEKTKNIKFHLAGEGPERSKICCLFIAAWIFISIRRFMRAYL
jgi:glycosyltransferase involved in cell wall biosynthesis